LKLQGKNFEFGGRSLGGQAHGKPRLPLATFISLSLAYSQSSSSSSLQILYNIMKLYFFLFFKKNAFFMLACSPLGGQAHGKPCYPT
jgi:hypothetical protein